MCACCVAKECGYLNIASAEVIIAIIKIKQFVIFVVVIVNNKVVLQILWL